MFFNKFSNKENKNKSHPQVENDFSSPEQATDFLRQDICDCLGSKTELKGDTVFLSEWNISILPRVVQLKQNMAVEEFFLSCPNWDMDIYECSAALGSDRKTAVGMAQSGFMFGLMSAVTEMLNKNNEETLKTEFVGQHHRWRVYIGDIVDMGETPRDKTQVDMYWKELKDMIAQRIGNQKMVYVKIFASNSGNGEITGECRINDMKSEELSDVVAKLTEQWGTTQFGSHKQFFILEQEEETLLPQPVSEKEIIEKTALAMKMYEQCKTDEDYDQYQACLENPVGDTNLSQELYMFIPEICLQLILPDMIFPEKLFFSRNGETLRCYNTQLSSYTAIKNGITKALSGTVPFENTNAVLEKFASASATYNVLAQALNNGSELKDLSGNLCTVYNVSDDYILR